jgi:predicted acetyltransferase
VDIQIRHGSPDDYREIARIDGISFGTVYSEDTFNDVFAEPPSFLVATEDDRIVGVTGDYRFTMTVPGGAQLDDIPGVTWVSVLPTHRRRGVLSALMKYQLDEYAEAGEPFSILTASEGGIYRRFGYGPASRKVKTVVDRRFTRMLSPVDVSPVRFLPVEQARTVLPELHERWRAVTPAALSRTELWWQHLFQDREADRGGMSQKFYLVHPDGYLTYRVADEWNDGNPTHRCHIVDYRCVTDRAQDALWQVLLGLDLFATVESWEVPDDDHLPFLLSNPRQVQTQTVDDGIWLRPVDLPRMLAARNYQVELDVVLDVAGQRVALTGGPDGASCVRTDRPADAQLGLSSLGSVYLGAHRPRTLARAGLLETTDAGVLARLDQAFGTERAAAYGTAF